MDDNLTIREIEKVTACRNCDEEFKVGQRLVAQVKMVDTDLNCVELRFVHADCGVAP